MMIGLGAKQDLFYIAFYNSLLYIKSDSFIRIKHEILIAWIYYCEHVTTSRYVKYLDISFRKFVLVFIFKLFILL